MRVVKKYRSAYELAEDLAAKVSTMKARMRIDGSQFAYVADEAGVWDKRGAHFAPGFVTPFITIAGVRVAARVTTPVGSSKQTLELFREPAPLVKIKVSKDDAGHMRLTEPQDSMVIFAIDDDAHDDFRRIWWPQHKRTSDGEGELVFNPGHAARIAELFKEVDESETASAEEGPSDDRTFARAAARAARQLVQKFQRIALTTPQRAVVTIKYKPKLYGGRVVR